jgi:hypothetical protein
MYRQLYVLDARSGREAYLPVYSNTSTVDGPAFSVCRDGQGNWLLMVPVLTDWSNGPRDFGTAQAFARMDPKTGRLTELIWTADAKRSNRDEANALTVGGRILFCSEQEEGEAGIFGAFDLRGPQALDIPRTFTTNAHWNLEYNHRPLCGSITIAGNRFYKITNHDLRCWVGTDQPGRTKP